MFYSRVIDDFDAGLITSLVYNLFRLYGIKLVQTQWLRFYYSSIKLCNYSIK